MKAQKQGMTVCETFSGSPLHSESAVDKIWKELGFSTSDEQDEQIPSMLHQQILLQKKILEAKLSFPLHHLWSDFHVPGTWMGIDVYGWASQQSKEVNIYFMEVSKV